MKRDKLFAGLIASVVGLTLSTGGIAYGQGYTVGDPSIMKLVPAYETAGTTATIIGIQNMAQLDVETLERDSAAAVAQNHLDDRLANGTQGEIDAARIALTDAENARQTEHLRVQVTARNATGEMMGMRELCLSENQFGFVVLQGGTAMQSSHTAAYLSVDDGDIAATGYVEIMAVDKFRTCSPTMQNDFVAIGDDTNTYLHRVVTLAKAAGDALPDDAADTANAEAVDRLIVAIDAIINDANALAASLGSGHSSQGPLMSRIENLQSEDPPGSLDTLSTAPAATGMQVAKAVSDAAFLSWIIQREYGGSPLTLQAIYAAAESIATVGRGNGSDIAGLVDTGTIDQAIASAQADADADPSTEIAAWTIVQDVGGDGFFATEVPTVSMEGLIPAGATAFARYDTDDLSLSMSTINLWLADGGDNEDTLPSQRRVIEAIVICDDGMVVRDMDIDGNPMDIKIHVPGNLTRMDPSMGALGNFTAMCPGGPGRGVLQFRMPADGMVFTHITQEGGNFRLNFPGYSMMGQ